MKQFFFFFLIFAFSLSVFPQSEKDKPRSGEGVSAFLKRNNREGKEYYNQFLELNKNKLGKNNALLKDVSYTLPPLSTSKQSSATSKADNQKSGLKKRNSLFGKKYEEYTVKSDRLKGTAFYLSSGHGGPDPGATAKVDGHLLTEDEYAYDIILRLARNLLEEGATVHIIIQDAKDGIRDDRYLKNTYRETCMGATIPLNQTARLKQRSDKINALSRKDKAKYKRAVFLHLDSRANKKTQVDVYFYHAPDSKDGTRLVRTMLNTFDSKYNRHQPNRGYSGTGSARNLYVLKNTMTVGIYAELGNIQNSFDQRRFLDPDNRQALANWMAQGLIEDYNNWKKKK